LYSIEISLHGKGFLTGTYVSCFRCVQLNLFGHYTY
jgi:hypothetical protein